MTNKPQIRPETEKEFDKYWSNSFLSKVNDVNGEDYDSLKQFLATIEERAEKRGLKQLKQRIKDEVLYHPINGNEKQDTQYIALEKVFKDI